MIKKEQSVDFNEYFPALWNEAQSRGWDKGEFMRHGGFDAQRFSEFAIAAGIQEPRKGTKEERARDLSAKYFISLVAALSLSIEMVENMARKKFSDVQRRACKVDAWFSGNKEWFALNQEKLAILIADPQKWAVCERVCNLPVESTKKPK